MYRNMTFFRLVYIVSVASFVVTTIFNVVMVGSFFFRGGSWAMYILVSTVPINLLFLVLTLVYRKRHHVKYQEAGPWLKFFSIISLAVGVLYLSSIVFHVYSIVSYKHERALIQKALDECVVINKQYLDALRDTNPYFSEMTDPIVNKCLDEKIKF
jgi:hypothetical protein